MTEITWMEMPSGKVFTFTTSHPRQHVNYLSESGHAIVRVRLLQRAQARTSRRQAAFARVKV